MADVPKSATRTPQAAQSVAGRTGAQSKRRSPKPERLSFMRRTTRGTTAYWSTPASVPGYYPEIEDADTRAWHEAFAVGRQRAGEYIKHVRHHGGRAVSLAWIVGDMPAEELAALSLAVPRPKRGDTPINCGLLAGFFHGLMEMAARQVDYVDIELDARLLDARARGVQVKRGDAA